MIFKNRFLPVAKALGKRFACGAAVVEGTVPGTEEIAVQGDFQFEMAEYIADKMKEVPKGRIFFLEGQKKVFAFPDDAEVQASDTMSIQTDAQSIIDSL